MNNVKNFPIKKVLDIFAANSSKSELEDLEKNGYIEKAKRFRSGAIVKKGWGLNSLPKIGEQIGFFPKFSQPVSMAVFTTKGGVLKSTLALNIARIAALHNVRTCVVGLDIQGDITTALGFENDLEDTDDLTTIIDRLNNTKGLADLFNGQTRMDDIIQPTDLSN
ncbi:MAG: AAA family ATPase, partial [Bdellovibrionota bacterium]|nr:AAA family ATPase [Bdellovibrionota bacterium]